ncbi:MAG: hypothetical protein AAF432_15830 [Planctomycetota bacterium]
MIAILFRDDTGFVRRFEVTLEMTIVLKALQQCGVSGPEWLG